MRKILLFLFLITTLFVFSQQREEGTFFNKEKKIPVLDSISRNPTQAALYSAILPGLGQYYNKKYWKIPVVWGLIGTGIGFISFFSNEYNKYKTAYIAELNGQEHEFSGVQNLTLEALARAQDDQRRYRDYAIFLTALAYVMNILDATVDAHLSVFEKDKDLSFEPILLQDKITQSPKMGIALTFTF